MARALLLRRGACAILTLAMGWIMDYIRLRNGWEEIRAIPPPLQHSPLPTPALSPHTPHTSPVSDTSPAAFVLYLKHGFLCCIWCCV